MGGKKSGFIVPAVLAVVATSYFIFKVKKRSEKKRKKLLRGIYNEMLLNRGFSEEFVMKLETFRLKYQNFKFVKETAVACYDKGATMNKIDFEVKISLGALVTDCCLLLKGSTASEQKEILKVYKNFLTSALKKFFTCLQKRNPKNIDEIIFSWKHIAETKVSLECYNSLTDNQKKVVSGIFAKSLRDELLSNSWVIKDSYDIVKMSGYVPSEAWIKSFCLDFPSVIIESKKFHNLLFEEIKKALNSGKKLGKYLELDYPASIRTLVNEISSDLTSQPEKIIN